MLLLSIQSRRAANMGMSVFFEDINIASFAVQDSIPLVRCSFLFLSFCLTPLWHRERLMTDATRTPSRLVSGTTVFTPMISTLMPRGFSRLTDTGFIAGYPGFP